MDKEKVMFALPFFGLLIAIIVFTMLVFLPFVYLEGRAKSRWIKETKGIEIPWHEAIHLSVELNSVDMRN